MCCTTRGMRPSFSIRSRNSGMVIGLYTKGRPSCAGIGTAFVAIGAEIALTGRAPANRDRAARADPADERGEFSLGCAAHSRRQKPTAEAGAAAIWRSPRRRLTLPARLPSDISTLQSKGHLNLVATVLGRAKPTSVLGGQAEDICSC